MTRCIVALCKEIAGATMICSTHQVTTKIFDGSVSCTNAKAARCKFDIRRIRRIWSFVNPIVNIRCKDARITVYKSRPPLAGRGVGGLVH